VPEQDARYFLPEGTQTRMILSFPPRYISKVANSLKQTPLDELKTIGKRFEEIAEKEFGIKTEENVPSEWKFFGPAKYTEDKVELHVSNLFPSDISPVHIDPHSISMNMFVNGSLAMYGQLVRQRENLCEMEPLEFTAGKGRFVIPPTFTPSIREKYKGLALSTWLSQMDLLEKEDPNFAYLLLLGQEATSTFYGKGYGVIETSKERSEGVAQWEIRSRVGIPLTRALSKYPDLVKQIGPRCFREGVCKEPATFKTKKAVCVAFEKSGGNWKGTLDDVLNILDESSRITVFTVDHGLYLRDLKKN
jgi:hypothetical protein